MSWLGWLGWGLFFAALVGGFGYYIWFFFKMTFRG